jgi:hypothetical protein
MITDQSDAAHVKFEQPLEAKVMTLDGVWCGKCSLVDISDFQAQIESAGRAAELSEFFLLLTSFGNPVFRLCRREWVHGGKVGVSFKNTNIGMASSEEVQMKASGHHSD